MRDRRSTAISWGNQHLSNDRHALAVGGRLGGKHIAIQHATEPRARAVAAQLED